MNGLTEFCDFDPTRKHPTAVTSMRLRLLSVVVCAVVPVMGLVNGCTIGGAAAKPSLGDTTSAEQVQRIFWQDVKQQKWLEVRGLLTANVTWRNGRQLLTRDEIIPYLQQLQVKDYILTDVVVKANQYDMTVLYTVQLTGAGSGVPVNLHAVSVWQQVPWPVTDATKKEKKAAQKASPYLLTVEDLVADVQADGKASN